MRLRENSAQEAASVKPQAITKYTRNVDDTLTETLLQSKRCRQLRAARQPPILNGPKKTAKRKLAEVSSSNEADIAGKIRQECLQRKLL